MRKNQSETAIMLLAHKNEIQVNKLINHLSKDFDVYVHIDKRSTISVLNGENIFVYRKYKTYWGSFNQIMATFYLLEEACKKKYDRYLLISGQDVPLKTNKEIQAFFDKNSCEYLAIDKVPRSDGWPNMTRVTRYWPNIRSRNDNALIARIVFKAEKQLVKLASKIKKRPIDYDFYGGANWINLTHYCVQEIMNYIAKDKKYIERFKWTCCADELFYQTIINKISGLKIENNCLRYIDGDTGPEKPRILRKEDYEKLMQSEHLFARKFDMNTDNDIIELLYKTLNEKENNCL
ncbi:MAG: beta-1,6-N-acetylglucosaminyltransferase [Bacteroidales bacterium]|jgi:hypothetical protein|nr:beta-1,6-N-acetylglucosaminyltransferase [Bacteroidales bacterium]